MTAGRPSLYREEYCDEIVSFCGEGASITSFAAEIGVDRDTITEWGKTHSEFSGAVKRAKAKIAAWWNKQARDVAENGGNGGRATLIVFGLKNTDPEDFRDKTEHELTGKDGEALIPVVNVVIASPDQSSSAPEAGVGSSDKGN